MTTWKRTAGVIAVALAATACTSTADRPAPPAKIDLTKNVRLVAYTSCDDMLNGLRTATAGNVSAWGLGPVVPMMMEDAAAAKSTGAREAAPAHSTTNVHEAGVDEPDMVKTDGNRLITVNQGVLRVIDTATRKVTATHRLVPEDQGWAPADLLISGDRALVLLTQGGGIPFGAMAKQGPQMMGPRYVLVDLSGEVSTLGALTLDGSHVDARMLGSTVRIVTRTSPQITLPELKPEATEAERIAANKEAVMRAPASAWLPKFTVESGGQTTETAVKCENVSHPAEFTGTSLLTVHTLDLAGTLGAVDPIAVAADGDTVYGTQNSLYVTSNPNWWFPMPVDLPVADDSAAASTTPDPEMPSQLPDPTDPVKPSSPPSAVPSGDGGGGVAPKAEPSTAPAEKLPEDLDGAAPAPKLAPVEPSSEPPTPTVSSPPPSMETITPSPSPSEDKREEERTQVHRFDITGAGAPRYVSSAAVPGRLLNQYSLSEHNGHLRVATTSNAAVFGAAEADSQSGVFVLKADTLAQVGQITGLGKGERIYSVRFIGDLGYVVTFRQVDPLYALDLRDPANPKVTGELKISGYSAYLHPAGPGRLIGVGQEASEKGRVLGTQISLFDVADPAAPRLLSRFHQENSGTEAEWDPHAFLYWPQDGLALLPLMSWGNNWADGSSALVLKVSDSGIAKSGLIRHPRPAAQSANQRFAPPDPGIRRCVIIGDEIWTISDLGVKVTDQSSLDGKTWISFT